MYTIVCVMYVCACACVSICVCCGHMHVIPYSGKFSRDKMFADGFKNEDLQIRFSWMLAYRAE